MTSRPDLSRDAIFLDTSALCAALDRRSERHGAVAAEFQRLLRGGVPLLTTDAVVTEFQGLTLGRLGPTVALDALDRLLASPRLRVVATGPNAIRASLEYLRARPNRRLSLVDATSFAAMRDREIATALTLDTDFVVEGFTTLP